MQSFSYFPYFFVSGEVVYRRIFTRFHTATAGPGSGTDSVTPSSANSFDRLLKGTMQGSNVKKKKKSEFKF